MGFANNVLLSVSATGTNVYTSAIQDAQGLLNGSAQFTSGGAVGTGKLQACDDPTIASNWVDIPSATVSVTGAGSFLIPKIDMAYRWVRLVYTNTSGSGNVTGELFGYVSI